MIDQIKNQKLSTKDKIDKLLELDCTNYMYTGIDSTKAEIKEVKKQSRIIYRAIQKLDSKTGELLLKSRDK